MSPVNRVHHPGEAYKIVLVKTAFLKTFPPREHALGTPLINNVCTLITTVVYFLFCFSVVSTIAKYSTFVVNFVLKKTYYLLQRNAEKCDHF